MIVQGLALAVHTTTPCASKTATAAANDANHA
jgi:hypothetical protein